MGLEKVKGKRIFANNRDFWYATPVWVNFENGDRSMGVKRLTDIMREMGLIDEKQIQMALRRQHMIGARVGTQLVHLGFIDEDQLAEALSKLYRVPPFKMEMVHEIDEEVRGSIPKELVEQHKILPVRKAGKRMTVAMINPRDLELIHDMEFRLGAKIDVLVCPEVIMEFALHMHYGIEAKKEYVTLTDEQGRVQVQQRAREILRNSEASHVGFEDLKVSLKDNILANVVYQMSFAKNSREALSCVLKTAKTIVQRVDLYLVRQSEGILQKWNPPVNTSGSHLADSKISISELSYLMKEMKQMRFFFGDKALFPDQKLVEKFISPSARKVMFVPIIVRNRMLALLYADNGQRNMTAGHMEALLAFSTLISLAFNLSKPSSEK